MTEEITAERKQQLDAIEALNKMFGLLDIDATVDEESLTDDNKIEVNCNEPGRLIGRKGQALEALELVMNRIVKKNEDSTTRLPWLSLDVDGYSVEAPVTERHEKAGRLPRAEIERLEALARDVAKEVKIQKSPRVIGPYSPAERRIIHLALQGDPEIETVSDAQADANRGKKITVKLVD